MHQRLNNFLRPELYLWLMHIGLVWPEFTATLTSKRLKQFDTWLDIFVPVVDAYRFSLARIHGHADI